MKHTLKYIICVFLQSIFFVIVFTFCTLRAKSTIPDSIYDKYRNQKWKMPSADTSYSFSFIKNTDSTIVQTKHDDAWWTVFKDPVLDSLEEKALNSNFDIKLAIAHIEEAKALVRYASSFLFPTINLEPTATANRLSVNRPNPFNPTGSQLPAATIHTYTFPLNLTYEIDVWGKYRSSIKSAEANYKSMEADYKAVRLSTSGDLAYNYFLLRTTDLQIEISRHAIETRKKNLELNKERYRIGLITLLDVTQAESDLQNVTSQLYNLISIRQQTEHALAVLCGSPAFEFSLSPQKWFLKPPLIPAGFPSELLRRRPDIIRQEYILESQNEQIGIYEAIRFPSININSSAGTLSQNINTLINPQSRTWVAGAGISLPIFQGGRISSNIQAAKARYNESLASYEKTILTAFQDTQNALTAIEQYKQQALLQEDIVRVTKESAQLSRERYDKGLITYFEVVNNDQTALNAQNTSVQLLGQQFVSTILLIKAIGGAW